MANMTHLVGPAESHTSWLDCFIQLFSVLQIRDVYPRSGFPISNPTKKEVAINFIKIENNLIFLTGTEKDLSQLT
jgi:hypothetical protein